MTDTTHDTPIDAEEAILRAAWAKAVDLFRRHADAVERNIRDNRQGVGAMSSAEVDTLRIRLDWLLTEHGWHGTYADPDVHPNQRLAYGSPVWPPARLPEYVPPADWPPAPAATFPIRERSTS